jgi:hypothetical protein
MDSIELRLVSLREPSLSIDQSVVQLTNCGCCSTGPDKNAYYNEFFLRGKSFLATRIPRLKVKGTGPRRPSSYKTEPNFYAMPFLPMTDSRKSAPRTQAVMAQTADPGRNVPDATMGLAGGMPFSLKSPHPGQMDMSSPLQAFLQSRHHGVPPPCLVPKNSTPVMPPDTLAEHVLMLSHHRMTGPSVPSQTDLSQGNLARAIFVQSIAARRQSALAAAASLDPRMLAAAQDMYLQNQRAQMYGEDTERADGEMIAKAWLSGGFRR